MKCSEHVNLICPDSINRHLLVSIYGPHLRKPCTGVNISVDIEHFSKMKIKQNNVSINCYFGNKGSRPSNRVRAIC